MTGTSKFGRLNQARASRDAEVIEEPLEQPEIPVTPLEIPEPERRGRGRPAVGKRSNPDYEPINSLIRRDLHKRLKLAAVSLERDMTNILEEALLAWEAKQTLSR
jgi:hypothetical protein